MSSDDLIWRIGYSLGRAKSALIECFLELGRAYLIVSAIVLNAGLAGYWLYLSQSCTQWCIATGVLQRYVELGFFGLVAVSVILDAVDGLLRWYYNRNEGDSR